MAHIGRGVNGGIDILQLAAAAKVAIHASDPQAKPPESIIVDTESKPKNKRHQKKTTLLKNDGPLVAKPETSVMQCKHKSRAVTKPTPKEPEPAPSAVEPKGGSSVMILKRNDVKPKPTTNTKKRDTSISMNKKEHNLSVQKNSKSSPQQELIEVKKRLEQEKSARKSCEVHYQQIQCELASTRQTLEHETQFRKNCQRDMQQLKEDLENERSLRETAQEMERNFNKLISAEVERIKELEKQLQHEQKARDTISEELQLVKGQLVSGKNAEESLREELAAANQIIESLQQKMSIDSASAISMKMELHSMKSRMAKVEEVENALKQEIWKVDRLQNELAKCDDIKEELEQAREKLSRLDDLKMELLLERSKVQELEAKLDDQTWLRKRSNSIPVGNDQSASSKYDDLDEVDINVGKLRKELHDTREALKSERKKNAALTSKKTKAEASSLKDWIDLALPCAEVKLPPATQISLSDGQTQAEIKKEVSIEQHEPDELHYFDGTKNEFYGDEETSPLDDELVFIRSAYSDEVVISKDNVTYTIELPTNNNDDVEIKVAVHIPPGYPLKGTLFVDIRICDESNCSSDMRKCLIDTLPKLTQMCMWEAEANYGQEALISVLNMADRWSKTEWPGILSKQFPSFKILQRPKLEGSKQQSSDLYSALIYTHHLIEPEKLQLVKKITSKLSLGGFIKSGKPGVILLASVSEVDCDDVLNELKSQASQKVFRSTAFKLAGKVLRQARDDTTKMTMLDNNNKDAMDELVRICEGFGLMGALKDII
jgi:hypothetical protein